MHHDPADVRSFVASQHAAGRGAVITPAMFAALRRDVDSKLAAAPAAVPAAPRPATA